ncbi:hypothetical protein Salat_0375200 [Sesamum alatum]|uniref:Vacuolar protein sorting-associated protein 54 N-terminal domain-containing protein n=1 Tax=Sesamum alatum TaxID=300844 RepID=A0AAE2CZN7_9LAMI|nr:hypothetical protein Salat_0375200 [Sesamum alatum]
MGVSLQQGIAAIIRELHAASGNAAGNDSAGACLRRGAVVDCAAGGGGKSLVLSLERTSHSGFGLSQLSNIDQVRHSRLLQQQPAGAGVVNYPLLGTDDPFLVGEGDESGKRIREGLEDCKCYLHGKQVVDAYALIGDVSALAEKIQSFFMQEVLSESHSALRTILQEV